jgi:hypothetical protein
VILPLGSPVPFILLVPAFNVLAFRRRVNAHYALPAPSFVGAAVSVLFAGLASPAWQIVWNTLPGGFVNRTMIDAAKVLTPAGMLLGVPIASAFLFRALGHVERANMALQARR